MISALLRKPGILMVMEPLLSVSILPKTIRMPFSFALGPSTSSIRYLAHHGLRIDSLLSKIIKVMDSPAPAISLLKQKMTNSQNQIAKRMKCNRSANSNFYRTQIRLLLGLFFSLLYPRRKKTLLYPSLCRNDEQHKEPAMIDTKMGN